MGGRSPPMQPMAAALRRSWKKPQFSSLFQCPRNYVNITNMLTATTWSHTRSPSNFRLHYGRLYSCLQVDRWLERVDFNNDGKISFGEFKLNLMGDIRLGDA